MELKLTNKLKSIITIMQEKVAEQLNMSIKDVKNLQIRIDNDKVIIYANEKPQNELSTEKTEELTNYV